MTSVFHTVSSAQLAQLQREQYRHDERNHPDIFCLSKTDRLKHYGLHYSKYVGRLARGSEEPKSVDKTVVDTALICLSAANTLHQRLDTCDLSKASFNHQIDPLRVLADAAGRFSDACEKIDHLEEFLPQARMANEDVLHWVIAVTAERQIDLIEAIGGRRKQLADRQFYIAG